MRICFVTDLHGDPGHYEQLTNLLSAEQPELLILGGDMHVDARQDDPLGTQVAYVQERVPALCEAWRDDTPGLVIAGILGNHDLNCTVIALRALHDAGYLVLLEHRQPWHYRGLNLLGLSMTPPSPYWVKDLERRDLPTDAVPETGGAVWHMNAGELCPVSAKEHFGRLPSLADELAAAPSVEDPWLFVCHSPPYNTALDRLPHLDYPIGSRAVRAFIERTGPLCALHGHVHESPEVTGKYADRVGRTLCINPGQSHDRLHAVMFDTADIPATLRHTVYA
ncbi:MAG: metallophosphoesterase [Planctomycetota bacterium]